MKIRVSVTVTVEGAIFTFPRLRLYGYYELNVPKVFTELPSPKGRSDPGTHEATFCTPHGETKCSPSAELLVACGGTGRAPRALVTSCPVSPRRSLPTRATADAATRGVSRSRRPSHAAETARVSFGLISSSFRAPVCNSFGGERHVRCTTLLAPRWSPPAQAQAPRRSARAPGRRQHRAPPAARHPRLLACAWRPLGSPFSHERGRRAPHRTHRLHDRLEAPAPRRAWDGIGMKLHRTRQPPRRERALPCALNGAHAHDTQCHTHRGGIVSAILHCAPAWPRVGEPHFFLAFVLQRRRRALRGLQPP